LTKAVHADRVYFLDRIRELGIEVLTHTKVHEIARTALATELIDLGIPVRLVGDVKGSRKFFEAIQEGTLAAIAL
jgi:hypothetical protein